MLAATHTSTHKSNNDNNSIVTTGSTVLWHTVFKHFDWLVFKRFHWLGQLHNVLRTRIRYRGDPM